MHFPVIVVVAQTNAVATDFVVPLWRALSVRRGKGDHCKHGGGPVGRQGTDQRARHDGSGFDQAYPEDADYVIVPATAEKHAEEVAWLKEQRASGAALTSIGDGVALLAETGVLDGRLATGHGTSLPGRRKNRPQVTSLTNARYVGDDDVASSAGVSAALPIRLALLETIAGSQIAHETAGRLGAEPSDAVHDITVFEVRPDDLAVFKTNMRFKTARCRCGGGEGR